MTKPRTWTPEDEEILRQLYLGRQSLERIAKRFETTKDAIKQKAYRMGLKRPKSKDAPKYDVATRLRVLLGQEVRPPTGRRLFSDEELLRFAGRGLEADELAAWRPGSWTRPSACGMPRTCDTGGLVISGYSRG